MKIEIFSDFACPFCYIGKKRLEQAIEQLGFEQQVEIEYKTYLLNPDASKEQAKPFYEAMMEKFDQSLEDIKLMATSIQNRASEVGLMYDFEKMQIGNTENAHRLAKWARTYKKEAVFIELVMEHYFTKGLNVNDNEALLAIVEQLDLPKEEAKAVLESNQYADEFSKDNYDIQQLQVTSIPFFVFENKYGIIGAEPIEVFTKTLIQAKQLVDQKLNIAGGTDVCGPSGCQL